MDHIMPHNKRQVGHVSYATRSEFAKDYESFTDRICAKKAHSSPLHRITYP